MPADVKAKLAAAYDKKFEFLFTQLGVGGTAAHVKKYVRPPQQHHTAPTAAAPDDADLSD